MQKTINLVIVFFMSLFSSLVAKEAQWKGLKISGQIIRGGIGVFGDQANYSLLLCMNNETEKPIRIELYELYNATCSVGITNKSTGKHVGNVLGRTGDYLVSKPGEIGWVDIGPHSLVNLSVGLDGLEKFAPGSYRGYHAVFGDVISDFRIKKNGDVVCMPDGTKCFGVSPK
jgi:hypothetical protein